MTFRELSTKPTCFNFLLFLSCVDCSFFLIWWQSKADPKGQLVFDRLLKACNEVVWKNESIIVLNEIKVDPPYTQDDCKLLQSTTGKQGSLERVQKIVSSVTGA